MYYSFCIRPHFLYIHEYKYRGYALAINGNIQKMANFKLEIFGIKYKWNLLKLQSPFLVRIWVPREYMLPHEINYD